MDSLQDIALSAVDLRVSLALGPHELPWGLRETIKWRLYSLQHQHRCQMQQVFGELFKSIRDYVSGLEKWDDMLMAKPWLRNFSIRPDWQHRRRMQQVFSELYHTIYDYAFGKGMRDIMLEDLPWLRHFPIRPFVIRQGRKMAEDERYYKIGLFGTVRERKLFKERQHRKAHRLLMRPVFHELIRRYPLTGAEQEIADDRRHEDDDYILYLPPAQKVYNRSVVASVILEDIRLHRLSEEPSPADLFAIVEDPAPL